MAKPKPTTPESASKEALSSELAPIETAAKPTEKPTEKPIAPATSAPQAAAPASSPPPIAPAPTALGHYEVTEFCGALVRDGKTYLAGECLQLPNDIARALGPSVKPAQNQH